MGRRQLSNTQPPADEPHPPHWDPTDPSPQDQLSNTLPVLTDRRTRALTSSSALSTTLTNPDQAPYKLDLICPLTDRFFAVMPAARSNPGGTGCPAFTHVWISARTTFGQLTDPTQLGTRSPTTSISVLLCFEWL